MYTVSHSKIGRPQKELGAGVGWLKVAGRRHWNAREKGTIQRERQRHSPTDTVNKTRRGEGRIGHLKSTTKVLYCMTHWTKKRKKTTKKPKQNKKHPPKLYINMDLSTFSTKGQSQFSSTLLVFEVFYICLGNLHVQSQPFWDVSGGVGGRGNRGEARLQTHAYGGGGGGSCILNACTLSTHTNTRANHTPFRNVSA